MVINGYKAPVNSLSEIYTEDRHILYIIYISKIYDLFKRNEP